MFILTVVCYIQNIHILLKYLCYNTAKTFSIHKHLIQCQGKENLKFVCLFVFYVPSTARSFRDGTPIYCPLRRTWSSVNTPFPPGIEPRSVAWQSITLPLRHASFTENLRNAHMNLDCLNIEYRWWLFVILLRIDVLWSSTWQSSSMSELVFVVFREPFMENHRSNKHSSVKLVECSLNVLFMKMYFTFAGMEI